MLLQAIDSCCLGGVADLTCSPLSGFGKDRKAWRQDLGIDDSGVVCYIAVSWFGEDRCAVVGGKVVGLNGGVEVDIEAVAA